MCGIMGYVGSRPAGPILIDGLGRLEYRGYDSAGIAVLAENGGLSIHKRVGKLETLASAIDDRWPNGHEGIGHTRWATHGKPSDINAHPHADCTGDVAVIHNGIVENYLELKTELATAGHSFSSETDTEVIPHLLEHYLGEDEELVTALRKTIGRLEGAHAIVAMSRQHPGTLVTARVGNAGGVVIGYGGGENLLASDLPALLPHTRRVVFLNDGEVAQVTATRVAYWDSEGRPLEKEPQEIPYDSVSAAKGQHKHFMLKEITEQPESILDTIRGRAQFDTPAVQLEDILLSKEQLAKVRRVVFVGMGTSLHAAMIGRHYMERIAGIPAEVDNASEYRYRAPIIAPDTLVVSVTQSGETVDTLAAMEEAKRQGALQITICNVVGSQATRIADGVVYTRCGLEIGVCSTKTFTASVTASYLLACYLGQARGLIDQERMGGLLEPLARVPYLAGEVTKREAEFERLAHQFHRYNNFLYLGRGIQFPVAMEGALKLKEVSYIHAEGYPAGEMKHGAIALIDPEMPVIAIALKDEMHDKMMSNIEQVKAREGTVIALGSEGDEELAAKADHVIYIPEASPLLSPIFTTIPLQFFSYHIALRRGCDIDQPRNLAKTVTVE